MPRCYATRNDKGFIMNKSISVFISAMRPRRINQRPIFLLILLLAFVGFCSMLNSTIIEINQNGGGDYFVIQQGISVAANGDTVLVHPGRYFENIDFIGKAITVASLYIMDENESYIHSTIIDGNQNGSCVKFISGEQNDSVLNGFTLENGTGTPFQQGNHDLLGGGIYFLDTFAWIRNCIIQNNVAYDGGGMFVSATWETGFAKPKLSNCTFTNNHAIFYGGGVANLYNSSIEFDADELCNIYLNYAALGNDIVDFGIDVEPMEVYIDTFTVYAEDNFFFYSETGSTISCLNYKIEAADQDLFVSPNGDDSNSGLNENEPLKTISFALIKIASNNNTIHLAEGTYSPSSNGERYPLNCRSYVSVSGAGIEATTLNPENEFEVFKARDFENSYSLSNLSLTTSDDAYAESAIFLMQPNNVTISNIRIHGYNRKELSLASPAITDALHLPTSLYLNNVEISDNVGAKAASFGVIEDCVITNLIVRNNTPHYNSDTVSGGGIGFGGHPDYPDRYNYKLINSEITNNVNATWEWPYSSSAIGIFDRTNLDIINCTIGNNVVEEADGGAIVLFGYDIDLNIINSILYGDDPRELYLADPYHIDEPCIVNISNSLVMGGEEDIEYGSTNVVNWLEGNLDENPLFIGDGDYPFALSELSPCIDAGTTDLPAGITLPEFDLAGNPRIYGETIDMGAYEWSPVSAEEEDIHNSSFTIHNLRNYPNPFNPSTTISFEFNNEQNEQARIEIFNVKGQLIQELGVKNLELGMNEVVWDASEFSSGVYFYKLTSGKDIVTKKMLLLK